MSFILFKIKNKLRKGRCFGKLSSGQKEQECDATDDDSSTAALPLIVFLLIHYIKYILKNFCTQLLVINFRKYKFQSDIFGIRGIRLL